MIDSDLGRRRKYCKRSCRQRAYEQRALTQGTSIPHDAVILTAAEAAPWSVAVRPADDVTAVPGHGLIGVRDGVELRLGRPGWVDAGLLAGDVARLQDQGATVVLLERGGTLLGAVAVRDELRPEAVEAVRRMRALGIDVAMLTGDNEVTARAVASDLGIDEVIAEVLPADKQAAIRRLQSEGRTVAMAGDGVNDAPALAAADVGIAMGTGADVAVESAGVTLVRGDLTALVTARRLSRATVRNIKQNLFFAFVYNALGVPVAAGILYPVFGVLLSPMLAAGAMALSSVFVVTNALRLRRIGAPDAAPRDTGAERQREALT
mgnify:CR=1 FL=1